METQVNYLYTIKEEVLQQNLSDFLKQKPLGRHPQTGKMLHRICCSGMLSSVIVLYDGSLLEMNRGFQIQFNRIHFPSYAQWMLFLVNN